MFTGQSLADVHPQALLMHLSPRVPAGQSLHVPPAAPHVAAAVSAAAHWDDVGSQQVPLHACVPEHVVVHWLVAVLQA
jgi:hypothetical protein